MLSRVAHVVVLLADFANGIFAVLLAAYVTGGAVFWWHFGIGIAAAMSPDLDALPELRRRGKVSSSSAHPFDHREGMHYPLAFILAGICFVFIAPYWGYVFLFGSMLHFVNDLYGTGWGIKLFWPISNRNYKFFSRRTNQLQHMLKDANVWNELPAEERQLRFLLSWSKQELPRYMQQWGFEDWIPTIYYRLNWISVIEYNLFLFACLLLLCTLLY